MTSVICPVVVVESQVQPNFSLGGICDSVNAIDVWCRSPGSRRPCGWRPNTGDLRGSSRHPDQQRGVLQFKLPSVAVDFLFLEDSEPSGASALLAAMSDPEDGVFDEIQAARDESKPTSSL